MDTKRRILLVDDETAITDNLAPFLRRAGYEVSVAADGDAALAAGTRRLSTYREALPDIYVSVT
jgi:DNA-binding response OmpR family regulator